MKKLVFYIDGFNLFHSLVDMQEKDKKKTCFKWLNIKKLLSLFIIPNFEIIKKIYYFSAYYPWRRNKCKLVRDNSKELRHKKYLKVLKDQDIEIKMGHFNKSQYECPNCSVKFDKSEEKKTDVAMGVQMLIDAHKKLYDTYILVSGDTDFVPSLEGIRSIYKNAKIGVIFPFNRSNQEYIKISDFRRNINYNKVKQCILPNPYKTKNGDTIQCPKKWL